VFQLELIIITSQRIILNNNASQCIVWRRTPFFPVVSVGYRRFCLLRFCVANFLPRRAFPARSTLPPRPGITPAPAHFNSALRAVITAFLRGGSRVTACLWPGEPSAARGLARPAGAGTAPCGTLHDRGLILRDHATPGRGRKLDGTGTSKEGTDCEPLRTDTAGGH